MVSLIALALLSVPQTTNCQWMGSVWTCNQTPSNPNAGIIDFRTSAPQSPSYIDPIVQNMESLHAAEAERKARKAERKAAAARQQLTGTVGALLADGRCQDAAATALKAGDIALAEQAKAYCK